MAMTVAEAVFVDANVLIYSRVALSPLHAVALQSLNDLSTAGHALWTSRQVLREYLAATTRPGTLTPPVPIAALVADVQAFEARFQIAEDGAAVTAELLKLITAIPCAGKQIHDANIVATMLAAGIAKLLTHNVADFSRFASHITVVPLAP
jgi:predicted nucleic acid-binding protein